MDSSDVVLDLVTENIRRNWARHFANEWKPHRDKLIGVLRTMLGSNETICGQGFSVFHIAQGAVLARTLVAQKTGMVRASTAPYAASVYRRLNKSKALDMRAPGPGPRSQSYIRHIEGFLTKKLGVSVNVHSVDCSLC